jgi:hypothetical protein
VITFYYERVSSDRQSESGLGVRAQRERNEAVALAYGRDIHQPYTDAGVSGSVHLFARREGKRMIDDIEFFLRTSSDRDIAVVTYSLDRLSRDVDDGRREDARRQTVVAHADFENSRPSRERRRMNMAKPDLIKGIAKLMLEPEHIVDTERILLHLHQEYSDAKEYELALHCGQLIGEVRKLRARHGSIES